MPATYASYTRDTDESIKAIAHSRRFRQAAEIIGATDADRVLDYGCADGHLFSHMAHTPHRQMIGFDPNPNLLAQRDASLADVTFFSDRAFARTLRLRGFVIEAADYLPFRRLGRLLNNEVYYSCRRPARVYLENSRQDDGMAVKLRDADEH